MFGPKWSQHIDKTRMLHDSIFISWISSSVAPTRAAPPEQSLFQAGFIFIFYETDVSPAPPCQMALALSMTAGSVCPRCGGKSLSSDLGELGFKSGLHGFDPLRHEARYGSRLRDQDKSGLQLLLASPHGLYPSVHVAERRSPSRDR